MRKHYLSLLILSVSLIAGCGIGVQDTKQNAERYARTYLRTMKGWNSPVVQCMGTDSDQNGYVTCEAAREVGAQTERLECKANWVLEYDTGCRELQRTININNQ